jgi:hypothetical protein
MWSLRDTFKPAKFYYWVPDVAATRVGISWHQLNARATSPMLTEYLTRFIRAQGAPS